MAANINYVKTSAERHHARKKAASTTFPFEDLLKAAPLDNVSYASASAPSVKQALLGHSHLKRYAHLADQWDFTSDQPPPHKIENDLGGTQQERWSNLDRMRSVARRAVRESNGDESLRQEKGYD